MEVNENVLFDRLTKCDFNDDELRIVSKTLAEIDFKIDRVCKYGQPGLDGVKAFGRIEKLDFERLRPVFESPFLKGIEFFPKGIINPEIFDVVADFGNQSQI